MIVAASFAERYNATRHLNLIRDRDRPSFPRNDFGEKPEQYTVVIDESEEGFATSLPGLPGCHSKGVTEAEAIANIRKAIREYIEVVKELADAAGKKQVAVEV